MTEMKEKTEEVIVTQRGKDLDVTFSTQEEAEEWRQRIASIMHKEGYHLAREKPETIEEECH